MEKDHKIPSEFPSFPKQITRQNQTVQKQKYNNKDPSPFESISWEMNSGSDGGRGVAEQNC